MRGINRRIFEACTGYFEQHKAARGALAFIYKVLPNLMIIGYPALLVYAWFAMRSEVLRLVLVPLGVFVFVTILRAVINAERPYERYGKPSVFHKKTAGKSMPSRHTASAFIIAMAVLYVNLPLGVAALAVAALITSSRVLAGAHFIRDVLVGAGIAVTAGVIFLFIVQ